MARGQGFRCRASPRKLGSCPEARCLNRIKQRPIRSIWDNNICQMNHFTGWPDSCPAFSYLEINPLVANRSGATWKGLPLAQWAAEVKLSQGMAEGKGQGRDTAWRLWKQPFSPPGSVMYFLLFSSCCKPAQQCRRLPRSDSCLPGSKKASQTGFSVFGGLLKVSDQWGRCSGNYCEPPGASLYCAAILPWLHTCMQVTGRNGLDILYMFLTFMNYWGG